MRALLLGIVLASLIAPLRSFAEPDLVNTEATADTIWVDDWDTGIAQAKRENKPVLVDFFSDGCGACRGMHKYVFTDEKVKSRIADGWVWIQVNTSHGWKFGTWDGAPYRYNELARHFRVVGVPTYLFIDSDGVPVQAVVGSKDTDMFADILDYFAERAYERKIPFETFRKKKHDSASLK